MYCYFPSDWVSQLDVMNPTIIKNFCGSFEFNFDFRFGTASSPPAQSVWRSAYRHHASRIVGPVLGYIIPFDPSPLPCEAPFGYNVFTSPY